MRTFGKKAFWEYPVLERDTFELSIVPVFSGSMDLGATEQIFPLPSNLRIQFGDILPYKGIGSNIPYAAGQKANDAVRQRWITYRNDRWPDFIVAMSEDSRIKSMANDLLYVAEKEDPPSTMLGHIREEINFYLLGLQEELYPDRYQWEIEEAIRLACLTQLILNQRDGYFNIYSIVVNTKGQVCEVEEKEGTEPKKGYPVTYHWIVRGQRFSIEDMGDWMDYMLYYGTSYVTNESVQGLKYIPLKNLVYYFRHYYIADLKGQKEAERVTTIVMTIWYAGLAYTAGGIFLQLITPVDSVATGYMKVLNWARSAGPWIYKKVKTWLDIQEALQPSTPVQPVTPPDGDKNGKKDQGKGSTGLIAAGIVGLMLLSQKS